MDWEFDILYALQGIHNPVLDKLMVFLSLLGEGGVLWILIAVVFLCRKRTRCMGIQMALSMLLTLIIGNLILKNLIARDRPCWIDTEVALLLSNPKDYSFPSGHSMNGFAAAVVIFVEERWPSSPSEGSSFSSKGGWMGIAALLVAALIAFSRLYNFVHFPTDVLAGICIGTVDAILVHLSTSWYLSRHRSV